MSRLVRSPALLVGLIVVALLALAACAGQEEQQKTPGPQQVRQQRTDSNPAATATVPAATTATPAAATLDFSSDSLLSEPAAPAPSQPALGDLLGRKIIQEASMQLKVEDVGAAFNQVGLAASRSGGIVAESSFFTEKDYRVASITVRVPVDRYQEVAASVRSLGEVMNESSSARDVTGEYTDLNSRLRNLEATELQYLELLKQATSIKDILVVQDRLNAVRAEIEQTKGRIQMIEGLAALATLRVELRPPAAFAKEEAAPPPKVEKERSFAQRIGEAWEKSLQLMAQVAEGALKAAIFSWWLVLPVLAILYVVRRTVAARGRP